MAWTQAGFICKASSPQVEMLAPEVKSALKRFLFHWCIYLDASYSTQWTHIVSLCILCWVPFRSLDFFPWFSWSNTVLWLFFWTEEKGGGLGISLIIWVYFLFFFLFCRISCAFFKCNIPEVFVFTSGSIIFFLFSLLLLLMFLQKTKLVCTLWRAEICLWSVVWYRVDSSLKQARLQMWFAEILLDTTHFWCLSFREVGQQIVLVDKIRG